MGSFLTSQKTIIGYGSVILMGLPYFFICLVLQFIFSHYVSDKFRKLYLPLSLFFSQVEIILIVRKFLKKLNDKEIFLIFVIGFSTMSSGVTIFYRYEYFQENQLAFNVLIYGQFLTFFLSLLVVPMYLKYIRSSGFVSMLPTIEDNDFLGLKSIFDILIGSFAGIVITVGLLRSSSYILGSIISADSVCLESSCESSLLFIAATTVLEFINKVLGLGGDSFKVAFIITKSVLTNEKEAFLLLSKVKFLNEKYYLVLVSAISNFINVYALGFCIGVSALLIRKIDKFIILFCLKSFMCAILVKLIAVILLSLRLLY